uniref:Reverse transcriptase domain-containing protein n=1 Tax=Anopheles stephensi TaxID=30069 RepID=A0A182YTI8_ANOST
MASSKAPGLDGIPNAALKTATSEHPDVFVRVFNDLLQR